MKRRSHLAWIGLIIANTALWFVFTAGRPATAVPSASPPPSTNPAVQRADMIRELTEIKKLLQQQNEMLQSGNVKVSIAQ